MYKDGFNETKFIESATIDLADDLGVLGEIKADQGEIKSDGEISISIDRS